MSTKKKKKKWWETISVEMCFFGEKGRTDPEVYRV